MDINDLEQTSIITVVVGPDGQPRVDLGKVSPPYAAWIFETVLEAMREMVIPPTIVYDGEVVYECAVRPAEDEGQ